MSLTATTRLLTIRSEGQARDALGRCSGESQSPEIACPIQAGTSSAKGSSTTLEPAGNTPTLHAPKFLDTGFGCDLALAGEPRVRPLGDHQTRGDVFLVGAAVRSFLTVAVVSLSVFVALARIAVYALLGLE